MKLSRASIALYIGLVFLSGASLGAFGNRYYAAKTAENGKGKGKRLSPDEFRKGFLGYMKKDLAPPTTRLSSSTMSWMKLGS